MKKNWISVEQTISHQGIFPEIVLYLLHTSFTYNALKALRMTITKKGIDGLQLLYVQNKLTLISTPNRTKHGFKNFQM